MCAVGAESVCACEWKNTFHFFHYNCSDARALGRQLLDSYFKVAVRLLGGFLSANDNEYAFFLVSFAVRGGITFYS